MLRLDRDIKIIKLTDYLVQKMWCTTPPYISAFKFPQQVFVSVQGGKGSIRIQIICLKKGHLMVFVIF